MNRPLVSEYSAFYKPYVDSISESNAISALENTGKQLLFTLRSLPENKGSFAYAPEKWTINDLVQHLIDGELIFLYRALRIARADQTPLAGFEQDDYVASAQASYKSLQDLIKIFDQTRALTIAMFKSFDPQSETNTGIANGGEISLRALGFIIAGHGQHHHTILKERYL